MRGLPLSLFELEEISAGLIEDAAVSWAALGRRLGRDPTTIAREVVAGGGRDRYRPASSQVCAEAARGRPRRCRLGEPGELRDRVRRELVAGRSPVAIWADLVADEVTVRVCVETIYTAVYAGVELHG